MRFEIALQLNSANTAELFKALQMLSPHFDWNTKIWCCSWTWWDCFVVTVSSTLLSWGSVGFSEENRYTPLCILPLNLLTGFWAVALLLLYEWNFTEGREAVGLLRVTSVRCTNASQVWVCIWYGLQINAWDFSCIYSGVPFPFPPPSSNMGPKLT